jgi:GNAT superfamily N-acetyltransferase
MEELDIIFDPLPGDSLIRHVNDNLVYFNLAKTGASEWHPINFFLKNGRGELLGGVTGHVWGGWLHVAYLWISEPIRGRGHGSRLMDSAEDLAISRGAKSAALVTHSFQAPGFYLKRGYEVFAELGDYPPGHSKMYLRKRLVPC